MFSKTKIFLFIYFLPPWFASLLRWGDDRTSTNFEAAPHWFYVAQWIILAALICFLFAPFSIRKRPSILAVFLSVVVVITLYFSKPIMGGEFLLISGSNLIAIIAVFLAVFEPNTRIKSSDIAFLFYLLTAGFIFQVFLYFSYDIIPSHSNEDVFVRFNGITNDSLSSSFIMPLFIPWAVRTRYSIAKTSLVIVEGFLMGSMFAVVFVPIMMFGYLIYRRLYRLAATMLLITLFGVAYFYDTLSRVLELKIASVLIHMRFFLNILGVDYLQTKSKCSEEFCESFLESGLNLSWAYVAAFYGIMLCFLVPAFMLRKANDGSDLIGESIVIFGAGLIVGSFVHPVPLIPYALPLFLITASVYVGTRWQVPGRRLTTTGNGRALA